MIGELPRVAGRYSFGVLLGAKGARLRRSPALHRPATRYICAGQASGCPNRIRIAAWASCAAATITRDASSE